LVEQKMAKALAVDIPKLGLSDSAAPQQPSGLDPGANPMLPL